jgi:hypothetical protein
MTDTEILEWLMTPKIRREIHVLPDGTTYIRSYGGGSVESDSHKDWRDAIKQAMESEQ